MERHNEFVDAARADLGMTTRWPGKNVKAKTPPAPPSSKLDP
jgi:hypothetical protein